MNDIDNQVAAFRTQLDRLPGASTDEATTDLFRAITLATTDSDATKAILEFAGANQDDHSFRDRVVSNVMLMFADFLAFGADSFRIRAGLNRFHRLALACRVANITKGGE